MLMEDGGYWNCTQSRPVRVGWRWGCALWGERKLEGVIPALGKGEEAREQVSKLPPPAGCPASARILPCNDDASWTTVAVAEAVHMVPGALPRALAPGRCFEGSHKCRLVCGRSSVWPDMRLDDWLE